MEHTMAEETIVLPGMALPPDIVALAERMKPAGFTLHQLPSNASAADIATAMREAEYLAGLRTLPAR